MEASVATSYNRGSFIFIPESFNLIWKKNLIISFLVPFPVNYAKKSATIESLLMPTLLSFYTLSYAYS